jgi:hypothetical protein
MNIYNEILNMFTRSEDLSSWMSAPFVIGNKVFATDNNSLIAMHEYKVDTQGMCSQENERLRDVYPINEKCLEVITFNALSKYMDKVPLIDEFVEKDETVECAECDGSGDVTYHYESKGGDEYEGEFECPICNGLGVVGSVVKTLTGIKIPNPKALCNMWGSTFRIKQIYRLYKVMKMLGGKDLVFHGPADNKSYLFSVEDIEIIIMPVVRSVDDDEEVCFIID